MTVCPAVVISLPGLSVWVSACLVVLSSHSVWLKVFPHFHWWGMTLVTLCLCEMACLGLPHEEHGLQQQAHQLGAHERFMPDADSVFFSRLGDPLVKAGTEFCWNRLMDLFSFVHLVLQSGSHLVYPRHQEGFACLGSQTLWTNLKVSCPGGVGPQAVILRNFQNGQQHMLGAMLGSSNRSDVLGRMLSTCAFCKGICLMMIKSSQCELCLPLPGHRAAGRAP